MRFPKSVLIYAGDYDRDGSPVLVLAKSLKEISEEYAGEIVAEYRLVSEGKLIIERRLK